MLKKFMAAVVAVLLLAVGVSALLPSAGTAAKRQTMKVQVRVVRGPDMSLEPYAVSDLDQYNLRCPTGYVTTGYGLLLGASELVYADPNGSGTGYDFAFSNPTDFMTTSPSASIICIRGTGALRVVATAARDHALALRQARAELR